ncbi:3-phosphoshikimate 1-carboxyvinyltransferase [Rhodothalassium salexigens]|nr:3-phosphoshikimate 1-carboxyvinyltransferase [Rhodothalassium salexigens]MBK5921269.1 3-phosphoshikimate 1-carboxyvinyltransferase [Rhodothalassium salexigens]
MPTAPFPRALAQVRAPMSHLIARPVDGLSGRTHVPGDKSISHRALILSALTVGRSTVEGLLAAEDVLATAAALRALGARIEGPDAHGRWQIDGVGVGGLTSPAGALDMGNSGTGARLFLGLLATHAVRATLIGDASLSRRPMGRVLDPLAPTGARFEAGEGGRLPVTVVGSADPLPLETRLSVPSAQVKSALLLAALNTPGLSRVVEPVPTRDHSERMLAAAGAEISVTADAATGARVIDLVGQPELAPVDWAVPGDISSAAFPLVAGLLGAPGGAPVTVTGVGVNPLRTGLLDALDAMGARIERVNPRSRGGEPIADLVAYPGRLDAIEMDPALAPRLIDECPILFVAAACAHGTSRFTGLGELRVKESDRLAAMADALAANGVGVEVLDDGLVVEGAGGRPPGGATVATHLDHRIAMSALVLGGVCTAPVPIDDTAAIATSFPGFVEVMTGLGAHFDAGRR